MPTFRQTNTLKPTADQFNELFDLRANTFWKYGAYSWVDPKTIYANVTEMRDDLRELLFSTSTFWQMFWEDDTLLGFRSFEPCYVNTLGVPAVSYNSPFNSMFESGWEQTTLKNNIAISRPSPSIGDVTWAWTRPEVSPIWNNNDGETFYEAMREYAFERAYSTAYGSLQKQLLWNNRHLETIKYDIWLKYGFKYDGEVKESGFNVDDSETTIYRLIGGDSLGWPRYHALYHKDNVERPEYVARPHMETLDDATEPPAPVPIPTV